MPRCKSCSKLVPQRPTIGPGRPIETCSRICRRRWEYCRRKAARWHRLAREWEELEMGDAAARCATIAARWEANATSQKEARNRLQDDVSSQGTPR
jgi:hypothetical protein